MGLWGGRRHGWAEPRAELGRWDSKRVKQRPKMAEFLDCTWQNLGLGVAPRWAEA